MTKFLRAELHYHRLVGRVRVVGEGGGEARLDLIGEDGRTIEHFAGPGVELVLNRLVRCCKGAAWSTFAVRIENPGPAPIRVEVDLVLLHDGVAVLTDDAEPGAADLPWIPGPILTTQDLLLGGVLVLRRASLLLPPTTPGVHLPG